MNTIAPSKSAPSDSEAPAVRLLAFSVEDFKAIRFAEIDVGKAPLIEIRGRNGAGKSSVIQALVWACNGGRALPEMPVRRGAESAEVVIRTDRYTLTRKVTRAGTATLTLLDAEGKKVAKPAELVSAWLGDMAADPIAFATLPAKDQAVRLADAAGLTEQLVQIAEQRQQAYERRTQLGSDAKRTAAVAASCPCPDGPDVETPAAALVAEAAAANDYNSKLAQARAELVQRTKLAGELEQTVRELEAQLEAARTTLAEVRTWIAERGERINAAQPKDVSAIQARMNDLERSNSIARQRQTHRKAKAEAEAAAKAHAEAERAIEDLDEQRAELVRTAKMPIPGISIGDDVVTFNGVPLASCSTAERIRIGVAAVLASKPQMRLVLIERGESLDDKSRAALIDALKAHNAVGIMERVVSTGASGVEIVAEEGGAP